MTNEIATISENQITHVNVFEHGETAWFEPETPALDRYKQPLVAGGRVVTRVQTKEFEVVFRTFHENPTIQSLYEEFKMEDNKLFWLSENRSRLEKHDINVDNLIATYKES